MEIVHPLKAFRDGQSPPISQEQLAERLGVNRVTVARWETGARRIDEDKITEISALTGIAPEKLRPDMAKLMGMAS